MADNLVERGLSGAFVPLSDPVVGSDVVGTTSQLLVADHPGNMAHNLRRVRIFNNHTSGVLGLYLAERGDAATGGVFANSIQIAPGQPWSASIDAQHRLLTIGSVAGVTYNFMVDDI